MTQTRYAKLVYVGPHYESVDVGPKLSHPLEDYRNAPSGIGPLAAQWKDKPHRLVYDLCTTLEQAGF